MLNPTAASIKPDSKRQLPGLLTPLTTPRARRDPDMIQPCRALGGGARRVGFQIRLLGATAGTVGEEHRLSVVETL